jgi:hypothetical protein
MVERLGGSIGLDETPEGERIRIHPASILTPPLVASLRREKAALVALLRLLGSAAPANELTAAELIAEVESTGAGLYLRPELGLVLYRGELISDELLRRLVRAHDQIEQIIRARYPHAPPEPEATLTAVAEPPAEDQIDGPAAAMEYAATVFAEYVEPEPPAGYFGGAWLWYGRALGCYREKWPERWPGFGRCSECRAPIKASTEAKALALFREHVESGHAA